jgi:hypothetical protein
MKENYMRSLILALAAIFGITVSNAQTDVQFQAHLPFQAREISFSAYIADDTFNEDSRLNTDALWYVENKQISAANGMINVLLEDIPTSVFAGNFGKIYVYSYVNGQPLGRLPFHKLPYALIADSADLAGRAYVANFAQDAQFAERADTADVALQSLTSFRADTATYARTSGHSFTSDTATYARNAGYAVGADAARTSQEADHADHADTADYAYTSGLSLATNFVNENGVNTLSIQNGSVVTEKLSDDAVTSVKLGANSVERRHITIDAVDFENIVGGTNAQPGSYLTRTQTGLSWETNPQFRTSAVAVYTVAPQTLPNDSRWIVSRVAVDYNLVGITNPVQGQLVTVFNGSTANTVTLRANTWGIDTALDLQIWAGQSRTLWFNGTKWVVVE